MFLLQVFSEMRVGLFFIAVNQIYYLRLLQTHFATKDFKIFSVPSGGITKGETNKEDNFI